LTNKADSTILSNYVLATSVYTKNEVNNKIADLVNSAPATLDTLNELANALGNDANFSATITELIGQKASSSDVYTITQSDTILKSYDTWTRSIIDDPSLTFTLTFINPEVLPRGSETYNQKNFPINLSYSKFSELANAGVSRTLLDYRYMHNRMHVNSTKLPSNFA